MDLLNRKTETLNQIVFRGRNQEYGAYQLKKKYPRTLLISLLLGLIIFLLAVFIPFVSYLSDNTSSLMDDDYLYEVDYMPFIPPEDNVANDLARELTRPKEEKEAAPVVTDSATAEKEKPLPDNPEKNPDSVSGPEGPAGGVKDGTGTGDITGLATVIDVYPRFPGGDEARLSFLKRNVRYPGVAMQQKIQGVVVVVFIIERDGTLSNIGIERGIGSGCDEESIRVVKMMPKWDPGKRQGRPVRVMVRMPIVFRIPARP